MKQPAGQRFLAGARAGGAEQFKQRTGPEKVEIGRVGVFLVKKTLSLAAFPLPGAVETGKAVAVERRRLTRSAQIANDLFMKK